MIVHHQFGVCGARRGIGGDDQPVPVADLPSEQPFERRQRPGRGDVVRLGAPRIPLAELRAAGKLPPLRRTVRFWWSTEIVSEREYFAKYPEQARKMILAVNLDQAGGDRNAENNFVAILGPDWLPSFADDLIYNLAEYVKDTYAPAEHEPSPLVVAPNG